MIRLGYAREADQYISREAMEAILAKHPMLSPATRQLILSGQATFTLDAVRFLAPAEPHAPGLTHQARFKIEHVFPSKGEEPCN